MTSTRKPAVPYAERLARESVKFGLRVGRSFVRHGPGLLKAGILGLPLAMLGGLGGSRRDDPTEENPASTHRRADFLYVENGSHSASYPTTDPLFSSDQEFNDYHDGKI
jgi:hypothetical protein